MWGQLVALMSSGKNLYRTKDSLFIAINDTWAEVRSNVDTRSLLIDSMPGRLNDVFLKNVGLRTMDINRHSVFHWLFWAVTYLFSEL